MTIFYRIKRYFHCLFRIHQPVTIRFLSGEVFIACRCGKMFGKYSEDDRELFHNLLTELEKRL